MDAVSVSLARAFHFHLLYVSYVTIYLIIYNNLFI
jgi:hypothetical protein